MRSEPSLVSIVAAGAAAFFLAAAALVWTAPAGADEPKPKAPPCNCSGRDRPTDKPRPKPVYAEVKAPLDENDEIAALEALQFALSEVGDGAAYVWQRRNGRLSGYVKPTASFRDRSGQVCRHILVMLSSGTYARKAEVIACRGDKGIWSLTG